MSLALATYENRIASLFESSDRFVIMDVASFDLEKSRSIPVGNNSPCELIKILKANNVTVLICGAISGNNHHQIEAEGIQVIAWITGDIQSVVQAYLAGNLYSPTFIMPGIGRRGRRGRHGFHKGLRKG